MAKTVVKPKNDGTIEVVISGEKRPNAVKRLLRAFIGRAKVSKDGKITIYPGKEDAK